MVEEKRTTFIGRWVAIFAILGLFTFYALGAQLLFSPQKVYAQNIAEETKFAENEYFVVLGQKALSEEAHHPNRSFWLKLRSASDDRTACAVSQSHMQMLAEKYDAEAKKVLIKDKEINMVVLPDDGRVSGTELRGEVGLSDDMCTLIRHNYFFYLMLLPGVS